jgi:hypothetical protein
VSSNGENPSLERSNALLGVGVPNTSPQRKQVNPRVALFKHFGTSASGTAFTRWRVGLGVSRRCCWLSLKR